MKKLFLPLIIIVSTLFTGCHGESKESVKDGDFTIELLFEKDGCKMYRFKDGNYIYWSNCQGSTQYQYSTQSGKTRVYHDVKQTTSVNEPDSVEVRD